MMEAVNMGLAPSCVTPAGNLGIEVGHYYREREALSTFSWNKFQETQIIHPEDGQPAAQGHLSCHFLTAQTLAP